MEAETVIEMTKPLLSSDGDEEDEEIQRKFVADYYVEAKERNRRNDTSGIYTSDLLFDAIPYQIANGNIVWWIAEDHPLAIMLKHNCMLSKGEICESLGNVNSPLGKIVIYSDAVLKEARETVVNLCEKFGLKIIK
jgi:hypothetical protein